MKLLLDENLSYRLVVLLGSAFPDSQHVDLVGLHQGGALMNSVIITEYWDRGPPGGAGAADRSGPAQIQRSLL